MKPATQKGFTLLEMAIVLMIVGLLLGGMLVPLTAQMDQRNFTETRKALDDIQQALIGYAIINGRLPCPASSTSNGVESFDTGSGGNSTNGRCSNFNNGFVPAATLGIASTVDNQGNTGFAVDAWGNRIHYAVTASNSRAFTSLNGMKSTGISSLSPDLLVCSTASTSGSSCSVANSALTASPGVPVVIYSTGKNGGHYATGTDEAENPNPSSADTDDVFVSHNITSSSATNGEFDDLVIWISPNVLINRMVAAGKLP
jgi:prepilin-type N-terminal cleavage/methylation domain-containing protein